MKTSLLRLLEPSSILSGSSETYPVNENLHAIIPFSLGRLIRANMPYGAIRLSFAAP